MSLSSWQACWASAPLSSVLSHAPLLVLPENPALPGMTCLDTSPRYKAARSQGVPAFLLVSIPGLTVSQAATECFPRCISVLSPESTASLFSSFLLFFYPFPASLLFPLSLPCLPSAIMTICQVVCKTKRNPALVELGDQKGKWTVVISAVKQKYVAPQKPAIMDFHFCP